ncbi:diacylglycerol kinase family protein [Rugamonas sp.]|uniref:diacylglycerol/lipid kinase family protein n=1 Tax=Rugamonas sp. TaxID=1926287 RepID=UPI00345BEE43
MNAGAGTGHGADMRAQLTEKFAAQGVEAAVTLALDGEEMIAAARQALARGVDAVVAGGGDGTINAVASVLAGSGVPFGVLPLGTLNHFAKDLNIPLELDQAIATIVRGVPAAVDVGEVNGRIFLNNSSLGMYPHIVRDRDQQQRRLGRGKWTAFGWAVVAALRRFPFLGVRLKINGDEHARRTPFVFIGNNAYQMEGFHIGVRERLDGGALSIYVAQRPTRFGLLRLALRALLGRLAQARDFDVLSCADFVIETRHARLHVATDGEVTVMRAPLCYRSRPAALSVLVPLAAVEQGGA